MNKNIYVITGFIPSDENTFFINIFQLFKIGANGKWYWANISQGSGIGFSIESPGYETSEDALIKIHGFLDSETRMGKWDFEEMLAMYEEVKARLDNQLQPA
jgi:hypothetical protein